MMDVVDLTDDASVKSTLRDGNDSTGPANLPPIRQDIYSFKLPGRPVPWKRPKVNRFGAMYNPQSKLQTRLKRNLIQQMTGEPLTGPILLEIDFYFLRPRNHFKRDLYGNLVRRADRPMNCTICRDIDNLAKLVLDALNGIAYVDDRQVVELRLRKKFSDVKYYYDDNAQVEEYTNIRLFTL